MTNVLKRRTPEEMQAFDQGRSMAKRAFVVPAIVVSVALVASALAFGGRYKTTTVRYSTPNGRSVQGIYIVDRWFGGVRHCVDQECAPVTEK